MTRYSLAYMYYRYDGMNWNTEMCHHWLSPTHHHCEWNGVVCCRDFLVSRVCANQTISKADDITELDLYQHNMTGVISPIFLLFPALQSLFLNENQLNGTVPDYLFTTLLPKLSKLYLQHNLFNGTLPQNQYNGVLGKEM
jgi:hypothetical protein